MEAKDYSKKMECGGLSLEKEKLMTNLCALQRPEPGFRSSLWLLSAPICYGLSADAILVTQASKMPPDNAA